VISLTEVDTFTVYIYTQLSILCTLMFVL